MRIKNMKYIGFLFYYHASCSTLSTDVKLNKNRDSTFNVPKTTYKSKKNKHIR